MHLADVKAKFTGKLYTQYSKDDEREYAEQNGIIPVPGENGKGLGRDIIHFNSNSGAQAINLAYLQGATRIILIGYDMGATGGKAHWFGDHKAPLANGNYQGYVNRFNSLATDLKAAGVEVINCTPTTALTQFERAYLGDVL